MSIKNDSFYIELSNSSSQNSADFIIEYPIPIVLNAVNSENAKKWEVALRTINMWNSYYTISSALGNNIVTIGWAASEKVVTVPDGFYSIETLNEALKNDFISTGTSFESGGITFDADAFDMRANGATGKVDIQTIDGGYFEFGATSFYELIGWTLGTHNFTSTTLIQAGSNLPDVNAGVSTFQLHVDLTSQSFTNSQQGDVIYSFSASGTDPWGQIQKEPTQLSFLPVKYDDTINRIHVRITDQDGTLIQFQDEDPVVIGLFFRAKE